MEYSYVIYGLVNPQTNQIDYVGRSRNVKQRMTAHRSVLGYTPSYVVLESGVGNARKAEMRIIADFLEHGVVLRNKMTGSSGCEKHSQATIELLRKINTGRKHTPESIKKMSESQKGLKREYTLEGLERRMATRFKPGINTFALLSPEIQERMRESGRRGKGKKHAFTPEGLEINKKTRYQKGVRSFDLLSDEAKERKREAARKNWDGITPEQRTEMARQRNLKAWADRTPAQRKIIGENIAKGIRANPDAAAKARINGSKTRENPEIAVRAAAGFKRWIEALTPEERTAFYRKRGETNTLNHAMRKMAHALLAS